MNYSLGNIISNGGAINPNGLSLDLAFAADKSLTARRGPTPTFSRASAATFIGSNGLIQSAAINAPRFDHDPVTLASRGLLIEEQRTNTLTRSEEFNVSPWNIAGSATIIPNDAIAPDGLTTADRFRVGATTQVYAVFNSSTSWTSGVTYTVSFFFKADQITRVRVTTGNQLTHPIDAIFDLTGNGSVVGTAIGVASIQRYANGWYRCAITATSTATGLTSLRVSAVSGTSDSYPGNSVDSFLIWGAQVEVGSFPTSYIPTTTASVVRSADVCRIFGTSFTNLFNAAEGTLLVRASEFRRGTGFPVIANLSDGSNANRYSMLSFGNRTGNTSTVEFLANNNNISQYTTTMSSAANNFAIALAYGVDNMRAAMDGTLGPADTPPSILAIGLNTLNIGGGGGSGIHIASVQYYRKRLTDAQLQSLTT